MVRVASLALSDVAFGDEVGHLLKSIWASIPEPAMRAISLLLLVTSAMMFAGPSAYGQATQSGASTAHTQTPVIKSQATAKQNNSKATAKPGTKPSTTAAAKTSGKGTTASKSAKTPTKTPVPPPSVVTTAPPAPPGAMVPLSSTALRDAPDGQSLATLTPRSTLEPIAHDRGWVRVRTEGWVKEADVGPMDPAMVTLSAADLRADPDGSKGKVVRWNVEVLAMQTADVLRKGLNPDEPYLLVRGPGTESALIYVAVPPSLLTLARTVASSAPVPIPRSWRPCVSVGANR